MQELRRQLELGPDPAEVRRAREWVRAQLDGGGGPGPGTPADTVVLLVSELVTNAVVHTGRPAVLRLLLPGEAHTHEEHEGPEEPPEERDARADERAGSAGRRARPAAGHREPSRPPEPARPVGRRTAAGEDRLDAPRPAAGARPGGAGAPTDATRVAAPSPEPGRPAAGSEAAMVVSLPGLLRLALPDHRPAGAVRGGAAPRPDGQHAEERRGVRRSAPETAAPDARPRAAGAGPRGADAVRSAVVRPLGRSDGCETGPAPQTAWVRVGVEPPALSAGVCPLTGRPTLRLEVFDHSSRAPRRRAACRDDTSGRGLELVELLADRWGWRREGRGKQIWCELDLPACEGGGHGGRRIPARS